jgi:uncharacterized protein with HEPN domain
MNPARDYSDYLRDIIDNAERARQFVAGMDYTSFAASVEKTYAVFHALEIIGEAARKIPSSVRDRYKRVPWREATGMRDKLIHGYAGVNLKRVWETVKDDLPLLIATVEQMLADLGSDAQTRRDRV